VDFEDANAVTRRETHWGRRIVRPRPTVQVAPPPSDVCRTAEAARTVCCGARDRLG
jgi:hypothetical protein